jgi:HK97 family phage major capsid protein
MTLAEMQEKRGRLVAQAREALEEIKKNTDEARAKELEARHDAIMAELDKIDADLAREERVAKFEREQAEAEERARAAKRPGADANARGQDEGDAPTYRSVFYKMLALGGDVSELSAEERAILKRSVVRKEDGAEFRAQTTSTTAGVYTVPVELAEQLVRVMLAWGPMYDPGVTSEMVTGGGGTIYIPTVNDTTVTAEAHTEATALTDDGGKDVTFGRATLSSFAFDTEFVKWSWELNQDSIFNIEALLRDLLGERLGRIANSKLTVGAGTTEPFGIVTRSALGVTSASASAITVDEIMDLVHSVDPAYRQAPKVRFMFNDTTLKAIRKLKDGNGQYIWQMGNIQNGAPGSLLGYSYSINQAMESIAAAKKVMLFGDFGKYYVRKVGQPVVGVMRERFWPDLGIAGLIRFDGELPDTTAVKHLITHA